MTGGDARLSTDNCNYFTASSVFSAPFFTPWPTALVPFFTPLPVSLPAVLVASAVLSAAFSVALPVSLAAVLVASPVFTAAVLVACAVLVAAVSVALPVSSAAFFMSSWPKANVAIASNIANPKQNFVTQNLVFIHSSKRLESSTASLYQRSRRGRNRDESGF